MFRELARKKQALSREGCVQILESCTRGVLSLVGDGGYPYGVPMNFLYCKEDGILFFHGGKQGHKLDAIAACDKASFCVMDEGYRKEGEWALNVSSVIVFGRIRFVEDKDRAMELCRRLCRKFTDDAGYIEKEIKGFGDATLCFELVPEHITGKLVDES